MERMGVCSSSDAGYVMRTATQLEVVCLVAAVVLRMCDVRGPYGKTHTRLHDHAFRDIDLSKLSKTVAKFGASERAFLSMLSASQSGP
jgi:hypothetical protein